MIRYLLCLVIFSGLHAQEAGLSLEISTVPLREEMNLVVTGMASRGGEVVAFSTKKGEVWILENPKAESQRIQDYQWSKFAAGLREPSGLLYQQDGTIIVQQSVETTLISDRNQDGVADEYMAVDSGKIPEILSPSPFKGIVWLDQPESSGPFAGQYFGGSEIGNYISRLSITNDEQGIHYGLFVFQKGLTYTVAAMVRLEDNSWIIAQSNRTDPGRTRTKVAVQHADWNEGVPFEVNKVSATDSGIRLTFTKKLLTDSAGSLWSYRIESLAEQKDLKITGVIVGEDEKSVALECEPLSPGKVYHVSCDGVWSSTRDPVRNPACLFTWQKKD